VTWCSEKQTFSGTRPAGLPSCSRVHFYFNHQSAAKAIRSNIMKLQTRSLHLQSPTKSPAFSDPSFFEHSASCCSKDRTTRTPSTAHAYPNAIKNNRMHAILRSSNKLSNKYLRSLHNAIAKKTLIVTHGRDTISRLNYLLKNSRPRLCDIILLQCFFYIGYIFFIQIPIFLSVQPIMV